MIDSVAALKKAIELDPRMDLAYFFLGNSHAAEGDREQAEKFNEQTIVINLAEPLFVHALAIGENALGQPRAVIRSRSRTHTLLAEAS